MSRKVTHTVIFVLLSLGVLFIMIVASLVIRRPTLISGDTQPQASMTVPVTFGTSTEASPLPVFTATSITDPSQSSTLHVSATPQASEKPAETPVTEPSPASNNTAITKETSGFCGTQGQITLISLSIEQDNNQHKIAIPLLRYVLFDFDSRQIRILSLPKSLIVSGKTIETLNLSNPSLDELFNYTLNNLSRSDLIPEDIGANMLARVLYEQIGIVPDYWVVLYAHDAVEIIDQFDAVSIPTIDKENSENAYNPSELWELLSQSNLEVQDLILQVMINRLHEPVMLEKIPILTSMFQDMSFSDLDRQMYLNLICALENTSNEDIRFLGIDDKFLLESENGDQIKDGSGIKRWVKKEFLGQ